MRKITATKSQNRQSGAEPTNLELNVSKTKKIIVDFRIDPPEIVPLVIDDSEVDRVDTFRFLGVHISKDLKWKVNVNQCVK